MWLSPQALTSQHKPLRLSYSSYSPSCTERKENAKKGRLISRYITKIKRAKSDECLHSCNHFIGMWMVHKQTRFPPSFKASQYWFVPCMGEENKRDASVTDRLMLCRLMTKPHGNSQLQAFCGRELKKQENGRNCLVWVCDVLEKLPSGREHRWRRDQWNQWKTKTGRGGGKCQHFLALKL